MKTSLCKAATPHRWTAPGNNERRLTVLHPRRRFLSLAAGAAALGEDTKRFIDRHVRPGDKRPAAPSVRRDAGTDQAARLGRKTGA